MTLPSPPLLEELFAQGPLALFLDFDGTLVELAPTPDAIVPRAGLAGALGELSEQFGGACAIVSGRALDDIAHHLGGTLPIAGAGSHGADVRDAGGAPLGAAPGALPPAIEFAMRSFAETEGLGFEVKPHGAALHYRENPAKAEAAHAFADQLAADHGWVTQSGKCVVELVEGRADKGSAVRTFMGAEPFAGARPIFIGDDLTDEKGFADCADMGGFGILVGERANTAAQHQLPNVASVHRWLGL